MRAVSLERDWRVGVPAATRLAVAARELAMPPFRSRGSYSGKRVAMRSAFAMIVKAPGLEHTLLSAAPSTT